MCGSITVVTQNQMQNQITNLSFQCIFCHFYYVTVSCCGRNNKNKLRVLYFASVLAIGINFTKNHMNVTFQYLQYLQVTLNVTNLEFSIQIILCVLK